MVGRVRAGLSRCRAFARLTTTVDRAWTDLPIRPGFLPLVQRSARHLAGRLDDRSWRRVEVGSPVPIEVSAGMRRLTVRGPNGKDRIYTAQELDGRSRVDFKGTGTPGEYVVWAEIPDVGGLRELTSLGFIVESHPLESNPSRRLEPTNETGVGPPHEATLSEGAPRALRCICREFHRATVDMRLAPQ